MAITSGFFKHGLFERRGVRVSVPPRVPGRAEPSPAPVSSAVTWAHAPSHFIGDVEWFDRTETRIAAEHQMPSDAASERKRSQTLSRALHPATGSGVKRTRRSMGIAGWLHAAGFGA
jgi:hypothetical protein